MSRLAAELPRCMAEILAINAEEGGYYRRGAGFRQIRAPAGLSRATRGVSSCGIPSRSCPEAARPYCRSGGAGNLSGSLSTILSTECDSLAQRNAGVLHWPGSMLPLLAPVPHTPL